MRKLLPFLPWCHLWAYHRCHGKYKDEGQALQIERPTHQRSQMIPWRATPYRQW